MKFDGISWRKQKQWFVTRCTYNNNFRSTFVLILPKSNEPFRVSFWKRTFWHLFTVFSFFFFAQRSPRFGSYYKPIWIFIHFFCIISGWVASCVFLSLSHSPVIFSSSPHSWAGFFSFFFHLLLFCNLFDCFLASVYSHSIVLLPLFHVSFAMPFHTLAFYFYCIACIPCKWTSEWVYASMCCILQLPSFQAFCLFLARRKKTNKETKRKWMRNVCIQTNCVLWQ